tara:strand:- start:251 stop:409 length:159 start_codon:yes stop_codon:yes gene_type:complete
VQVLEILSVEIPNGRKWQLHAQAGTATLKVKFVPKVFPVQVLKILSVKIPNG